MWLKGVESIEFVFDCVVTVECRYHSPGALRVRLLELPYNGRQGLATGLGECHFDRMNRDDHNQHEFYFSKW